MSLNFLSKPMAQGCEAPKGKCLENSYIPKRCGVVDIYPTLGIYLHWRVQERWLPRMLVLQAACLAVCASAAPLSIMANGWDSALKT